MLDVVKILFPSSNFLFCNVLILCLTFCWRENQNRRYSLNLSRIPAYPSLVGRCTSVYCEWQRLMSRSKEVKQEIIKVPFLDSKVTLHSKSPESDSRWKPLATHDSITPIATTGICYVKMTWRYREPLFFSWMGSLKYFNRSFIWQFTDIYLNYWYPWLERGILGLNFLTQMMVTQSRLKRLRSDFEPARNIRCYT